MPDGGHYNPPQSWARSVDQFGTLGSAAVYIVPRHVEMPSRRDAIAEADPNVAGDAARWAYQKGKKVIQQKIEEKLQGGASFPGSTQQQPQQGQYNQYSQYSQSNQYGKRRARGGSSSGSSQSAANIAPRPVVHSAPQAAAQPPPHSSTQQSTNHNSEHGSSHDHHELVQQVLQSTPDILQGVQGIVQGVQGIQQNNANIQPQRRSPRAKKHHSTSSTGATLPAAQPVTHQSAQLAAPPTSHSSTHSPETQSSSHGSGILTGILDHSSDILGGVTQGVGIAQQVQQMLPSQNPQSVLGQSPQPNPQSQRRTVLAARKKYSLRRSPRHKHSKTNVASQVLSNTPQVLDSLQQGLQIGQQVQSMLPGQNPQALQGQQVQQKRNQRRAARKTKSQMASSTLKHTPEVLDNVQQGLQIGQTIQQMIPAKQQPQQQQQPLQSQQGQQGVTTQKRESEPDFIVAGLSAFLENFAKRDGSAITDRDVELAARDPSLASSIIRSLNTVQKRGLDLGERGAEDLVTRNLDFLTAIGNIAKRFVNTDGSEVSARDVVIAARDPKALELFSSYVQNIGRDVRNVIGSYANINAREKKPDTKDVSSSSTTTTSATTSTSTATASSDSKSSDKESKEEHGRKKERKERLRKERLRKEEEQEERLAEEEDEDYEETEHERHVRLRKERLRKERLREKKLEKSKERKKAIKEKEEKKEKKEKEDKLSSSKSSSTATSTSTSTSTTATATPAPTAKADSQDKAKEKTKEKVLKRDVCGTGSTIPVIGPLLKSGCNSFGLGAGT
ncbi:hypothetical protein MMC19_002407 [Ptychographa xylographoides]|nr:hypothetical protein [Ptychographa xylographoides]